jgi:hypothetical protein
VLIRFLLALLLASFAVPAMAVEPACHGGGDAMAMPTMHHDGTPAPDATAPAHVCAGCVPLADWLGEQVPAPILPPAIGAVARVTMLDTGRDGPPALPPPRRG